MCLQERLMQCFESWRPQHPRVEARSRRDVTLSYSAGPFSFLEDKLLYKVQKEEKIHQWVTVYSGGKTRKKIENLAPGHPHKFRIKIIIKSSAVEGLSELAVMHYGGEDIMNDKINEISKDIEKGTVKDVDSITSEDSLVKENQSDVNKVVRQNKWLESQWSEETWTSTDSEGTSAACFCMAVRCGYLLQVQQMLEERPELISVINNSSGLTPLATAARKGDVSMVKFLLTADAEVDQRSSAGQTPLHLAVLAGHTAVSELLLQKGADFKSQDINALRIEHYAVDSSNLEMVRFVFDRGGDVRVKDSNGWTPLFRAVCQGADSEIVEELLSRGSDVDISDRRGLSLITAARILKNRLGKSRDSILKLVDSQYQHEKALANFTRITKKVSTINTMLNLK